MPIYEYQCSMPQCAYQITEILPVQNADVKMRCPKCGAPMIKLMTVPGLLKIK
jgi:putative FmdB family regulatory protein